MTALPKEAVEIFLSVLLFIYEFIFSKYVILPQSKTLFHYSSVGTFFLVDRGNLHLQVRGYFYPKFPKALFLPYPKRPRAIIP